MKLDWNPTDLMLEREDDRLLTIIKVFSILMVLSFILALTIWFKLNIKINENIEEFEIMESNILRKIRVLEEKVECLEDKCQYTCNTYGECVRVIG